MRITPPWYYDPGTSPAPVLAAMAELRLRCTCAAYAVPHMRARGSFKRIEAIKGRDEPQLGLAKFDRLHRISIATGRRALKRFACSIKI